MNHSAWHIPEPNPHPSRPTLCVYSSCHAWIIAPYLTHCRPEIRALYNLEIIVIHLAREQATPAQLGAILERSDFILGHPLRDSKWFGWRPRDFNLKANSILIEMESPQASCFFPVVQGAAEGELPVTRALECGDTEAEILTSFDQGQLGFWFDSRYYSDMTRMREREQGAHLKCADFIAAHHRTHKMFYTHNHPTMHVIGYMVDQFLGLIGHPVLGEAHALSLDPALGQGGQNHFPETEAEWAHYGFTYPAYWKHAMGGAAFYREQIRGICRAHK